MLTRAGLSDGEATEVLQSAFDAVAEPLDPLLAATLRDHLSEPEPAAAEAPAFVHDLERQPRAGATRPGHPRLILEPPESHADHCMIVAVYAVLVGPAYRADPAVPFLAGLSHHFHNAVMPDSGFAGEMLLGRHLEPVMARLTEEIIATLPDHLARACREARTILPDAETPEAKAFHSADVIDRVLQMDQYARVAELRTAACGRGNGTGPCRPAPGLPDRPAADGRADPVTALLSPTTGRPLRADGPGSLTDGAERWPVVAGIPYLRTGRRELAAQGACRHRPGRRARGPGAAAARPGRLGTHPAAVAR